MKLPKIGELKEAVKSLFSSPYTVKFPEGPAKIYPRFKGRPKPESGCVACGACSIWCPAEAIELFVNREKGIRQVIFHYDKCIMCGECERICTTQEGVKMDTKFDLAGFEREALKENGKECELVFCESCGEIISTKEHIDWMLERLGEKQGSNLGLLNLKLKKLGLVDGFKREITLDKRDDIFTLLCPKCRHKVILHDSK